MRTLDIVGRLEGVVETSAADWVALCPAHEDRNPSLSVRCEDGRTLIKCFAGCPTENVLDAMGLKLADLFDGCPGQAARKIVKAYDYVDEAGAVLFQVVRYEPKGFAQRIPDGDGYNWKVKGVRKVLYRLPRIIEGMAAGKMIVIAEGEKDVEALESLGVWATCNSGGAGKWSPDYTDTLEGATVVIIEDNDEPGRRAAQSIARQIYAAVESVKIIAMPDRNGTRCKDAADWIHAGGTRDELAAMVEAAAEWQPYNVTESATDTATSDSTEVNTVNIVDDGTRDRLKARYFDILNDKTLSTTDKHKEIAAAVLETLHDRGRLYYHTEHRDFAHTMFFDSARKILLNLASDEFLSWLSSISCLSRSERAFDFCVTAIQDEALQGNTTGIVPSVYWHSDFRGIYLSNGAGTMARITADGVAMVDNGTDDVLFAAGRTLDPWKLTDPADPFVTCRLFREAATQTKGASDILKLWMLSLPTNQRCKPPIVLTGPIGSGKTRLGVGIFELYGISPRIISITEGGEDDYWTQLDAGGVVCFDNADTRIKWLADALASAATAGLHEKRMLYSDSGIIRQAARAWVVVTSANPTFASDAGLADRLIVTRLDRRNSDTAEMALGDEIRANRDGGMSWVCGTLAAALADTGDTPSGLNRRHPDFARLAVRLGRAMGREQEAIEALKSAEVDKSLFNLQNDEVGAALLELGEFEGTCSELAVALREADPSFDMSVKRLGKRLAKLWPHLESTLAARQEVGHKSTVRYSFAAVGGCAKANSAKPTTSRNSGTFAETCNETLPIPETTDDDDHDPAPPEGVEGLKACFGKSPSGEETTGLYGKCITKPSTPSRPVSTDVDDCFDDEFLKPGSGTSTEITPDQEETNAGDPGPVAVAGDDDRGRHGKKAHSLFGGQ